MFAGPGSPTFALAWRNTPVPGALADKLRSGGAVVFSSAAALTLGTATVPVYEIYKVGLDPYWLNGLDVLAEVGLNVAVIPHYDNAEGGNHDTRFCYLGERRLAMLEPELPDGCFVLGIDEHTGVVMDLDADTADIVGKGAITLRHNGQSSASIRPNHPHRRPPHGRYDFIRSCLRSLCIVVRADSRRAQLAAYVPCHGRRAPRDPVRHRGGS